MRRSVMIFAGTATVLGILNGCGGGDESNIAGERPLNRWNENAGIYSGCSERTKTTVEFVTVGSNQATLTYRQDVYDLLNCGGKLRGSFSAPLPIRIMYLSTESTPVVGLDGTTSELVIDKIQVTAPAMTMSLTGDIRGSCIAFTGGMTCYESLLLPASVVPGGLYISGEKMATLTFNGTTYTIDTPVLTRQY